jgi:Caspase domain
LEGRRLVLVIGNRSYSWAPLVNPANDARALAAALDEAGFAQRDVQLVLDSKSGDLRRDVREFVESVKRGDLAFIYYCGHGSSISQDAYILTVPETGLMLAMRLYQQDLVNHSPCYEWSKFSLEEEGRASRATEIIGSSIDATMTSSRVHAFSVPTSRDVRLAQEASEMLPASPPL